MPNFIEVCAGAGGLSKGFIDQGFEPLLLNDIDKYCVETLKVNHPNANIIQGSMNELDISSYKDVDVFMGGVPCQSFSQAGLRKGILDERGKLILTFIDMVHQMKPKVFIIENVKGLLTHDKGKTLEFILNRLKELDYNVQYDVLNANDYTVPQNRWRVFIVGTRKDLHGEFIFPQPEDHKPILQEVLIDCPSSEGIEYNEYKKSLFTQIPPGGCWINLPEEIQKEYMGKSYYSGGGKRGILKRLDMNKPCLTLLTSPSQKQTERCHPTETRPLQILEYARIQTFPDDYQFIGSLRQKYKQIGNAVPVNLAKALAVSVLKFFEK